MTRKSKAVWFLFKTKALTSNNLPCYFWVSYKNTITFIKQFLQTLKRFLICFLLQERVCLNDFLKEKDCTCLPSYPVNMTTGLSFCRVGDRPDESALEQEDKVVSWNRNVRTTTVLNTIQTDVEMVDQSLSCM